LNESLQAAATGLRVCEDLPLAGAERAGLLSQQKLNVPGYDRQGGPQFVRGGGARKSVPAYFFLQARIGPQHSL
jgi:hypothetical protein